jgi:RNA polymerase sigma factor (sigma-70 family)
MAELKTDRELLREYSEQGVESAFRSLVERHLDLVFATASRGLGDAGVAQEITQNVFITLSRKAAWLRGETSIAAWLHKAALLEVRRWWRGELRRRRREQMAVELGTIMKDENSLLQSLTGELDEGLLGLRAADRQALMLRYFEGRSHREIGALLGVREDAVRMRIDKALDRLTRFFRRRGYAVPAVATTMAVLGAAAKAAPAGFAVTAARSALAAGGRGGLTGLKLYAAKFMGLTKTQTTALCVCLATAPVAWEWNMNRLLMNRAAAAQAKFDAVLEQQIESSNDLDRLSAESARLEVALAETVSNQVRYDAAAAKLESMKARVRGLLTDPNYRWPEDLPYVRVPKTAVKSLDLLNRPPTAFGPRGKLTDAALELFGITAEEQAPTEQALGNYWRGVNDMMTANAYETNSPDGPAGRLIKTVVVPPLGQPLQTLAGDTAARLTDLLGADREKLLFEGWDQGEIQIFWPGNQWKIAEKPQTFSVWVDPAAANAAPAYGASWSHEGMGTSSEGQFSLMDFPSGIVSQFFSPWLSQFGITPSTAFPGGSNE